MAIQSARKTTNLMFHPLFRARAQLSPRPVQRRAKVRRARGKLPPGPAKILDSKKINVHTADIERANSTNSSLLRLPSEIRNRIYGYVFGIGLLHVGSPHFDFERRDLHKAICRAENDEFEWAKILRDSYDEVELQDFSDRHGACCRGESDGEGDGSQFWKLLRVLSTCRQVHREAALLPYQLNTFFFARFQHFARFRDVCGPEQRKAIRSIRFDTSPHMMRLEGFPQLHDMRGVQDLSIFVQSSQQIENIQRDEDFGLRIFKHIKNADLELQKVAVTIVPAAYDGRSMLTVLEEFTEWSARVEKGLLEVDKATEERTKKRTRSGKGYASAATKKQKLD